MRAALLPLLMTSCSAPVEGDAAALVRLTATQWENASADLVRLDAPSGLSAGFVSDPSAGTFDNNAAELQVGATLQQQLQDAAITLAEDAVADPYRYFQLVGPDPNPAQAGLARDLWLAETGRRAFRRPLTSNELAAYRDRFDAAADTFPKREPFAAGVQLTTVGFLQSPHFLYRVDRGQGGQLAPLSFATKLSFSLWNAPPDDTLLAAAEAAVDPDDLLDDVPRLLADDRARDMVHDLHWQLFHLDSFENIPRPFVTHEDYETTLNAAMQAEVGAFVEDVVFSGGTVADLLTRRTTYVDAQVAEIYGVGGVVRSGADTLRPVALPEDERAGLLTMSGFLAVHSSESSENLIRRSAFVHEALLCTSLPPPPPDALAELPGGRPETARQRIEEITGECGGACHQDLLNPLAFAFGQYDELGRYRGDPDIDTTAEFTFSFGRRSFDGAVELAELLADDADVHRCYARHLLSYLEGRTLDGDDADRVAALTDASLAGEPILGLIADIVADPAYRRLR